MRHRRIARVARNESGHQLYAMTLDRNSPLLEAVSSLSKMAEVKLEVSKIFSYSSYFSQPAQNLRKLK